MQKHQSAAGRSSKANHLALSTPLRLSLGAVATVFGIICIAYITAPRETPHVSSYITKAETPRSSSSKPSIRRTTTTADAPKLIPEDDPVLQEWNKAYHARRAQLRRDLAGRPPLKEHTFFTIDCTHHSLWQSMTLEYSWATIHSVNGGGFLTRIVSGCTGAKHKREDVSRDVLPTVKENAARRAAVAASGRAACEGTADETCFGVYHVPKWTKLPSGETYAPFNRPNGIWYWLNHTDLTEDVFVLLDPDMVYLSRLRGALSVRPGRPAAQYFAYMDFPRLNNYDCPLCAKPGSFDRKPFAVGPPWMIHIDDLRTIMKDWVALVPMLRKLEPGNWIVEMVAYAVACAYHGMPHTLLYRAQVDAVDQAVAWNGTYITGHELEGEAREAFETGRGSSVTTPRIGVPHNPYDADDDERGHPVALIHYCYTWEVGEKEPKEDLKEEQHQRQKRKEKETGRPVIDYYHWSKYRMPTDWPGGEGVYEQHLFSCDAPLMQEFHTPWALPLNAPNITDDLRTEWRRHAFMLHVTLPRINDMLRRYRNAFCAPNSRNFGETLRTSHPGFWESEWHMVDQRQSPENEAMLKEVPAGEDREGKNLFKVREVVLAKNFVEESRNNLRPAPPSS